MVVDYLKEKFGEKLPGGLSAALELGIVPFGADEFDYAYILDSGEIQSRRVSEENQ